MECVLGDDAVLIGGDDPRVEGRQEGEGRSDAAADEAGIFADASAEDEQVESAEGGGVGADALGDAMAEDVDGELSGGVGAGEVDEVSHIGRAAGQGL